MTSKTAKKNTIFVSKIFKSIPAHAFSKKTAKDKLQFFIYKMFADISRH